MPMTADEAITAIRECAYMTGTGAESAALTQDAEEAVAAIREAFAIADRAREALEQARADEEATRRAYAESSDDDAHRAYIHWTRQYTLLRELKRIIGE